MTISATIPGGLDDLDELAIAAADELADLSALFERRGPYCSSVTAGAYSRVRTVRVTHRTREASSDWRPLVHAMIDCGELDRLRTLRRGATVSLAYLHRLVDELAADADHATGRNCMPGHAELGERLGRPVKPARLAAMAAMSPADRAAELAQLADNRARQVGNALWVLMQAGLVVRVEEGRILNGVERVELHANGDPRRVARAVYALTLSRSIVLPDVDNPAPPPPTREPVFGPPRSGKEGLYPSVLLEAFQSVSEENPESTTPSGQPPAPARRLPAENDEQAAAARRPAPKRRALWELDRDQYAFVTALKRALPGQLAGVSVRKLAGTTNRFYRLGWDPLSVAAEVVNLYDRLGRRFPSYRPGNPAAWLGWALKHVDPAITPAVRRLEDSASQADTEPCPHDWPGGTRISIVTGRPKCPHCRATS